MIGLRISTEFAAVRRAYRRLEARTRVVVAQELNTQRRQSRTRIVRGLAVALGVKPRKRLRRRLLLPRAGSATPRRLSAEALSLVEVMPARYFARGRRGRGARGVVLNLPAGTAEIARTPTRSAPFWMQTGPVRNVTRRAGAARLPVHVINVDTRVPGYRVRAEVLAELAREFPRRFDARMRREARRLRGA